MTTSLCRVAATLTFIPLSHPELPSGSRGATSSSRRPGRRGGTTQRRSERCATGFSVDEPGAGESVEPVQPGEEALYRRWVTIRTRLEVTLGEQSKLPPALAAYAVGRPGHLRLLAVEILRDEYGVDGEPLAKELLPLLGRAAAVAPPLDADETTIRSAELRRLTRHSEHYGKGYLDDVREGWPD